MSKLYTDVSEHDVRESPVTKARRYVIAAQEKITMAMKALGEGEKAVNTLAEIRRQLSDVRRNQLR